MSGPAVQTGQIWDLMSVMLSDQTKIQYQPHGLFVVSTACDCGAVHPCTSYFLSNDEAWVQLSETVGFPDYIVVSFAPVLVDKKYPLNFPLVFLLYST
jgi:hypothetical protein